MTYDLAYQKIASLISKLYKEHRCLLNSSALFTEEKQIIRDLINEIASPSHMGESLKNVAEYLSRHHKVKLILLIDEYDTPIHAAYLSSPRYHEQMLEFMRSFFGEALKDNTFLHKAVITGILRIAQANLFSDLNNLDVYTLLRPAYKQYFGFTTDEVTNLVVNSKVSVEMNDIQSRYNGYCIGDTTL